MTNSELLMEMKQTQLILSEQHILSYAIYFFKKGEEQYINTNI